ncbi:MAG: hypothetical protein Q8N63_04255 [Nanoarchaeota archaeon]|nr:hypothetical protein [Nanoarchaeota archaeon]
MARVIVTEKLKEEINKTFKKESIEIFQLIYSLKENPKKGKELTHVGNIILKELKYKNFRFYFITDGFKLKMLKIEELTELLIKFVRMSDKKYQQKTINEIKFILKKFGKEGFD